MTKRSAASGKHSGGEFLAETERVRAGGKPSKDVAQRLKALAGSDHEKTAEALADIGRRLPDIQREVQNLRAAMEQGVLSWRRHINEQPPSADAIGFLLISHEDSLKKEAAAQASAKGAHAARKRHSQPGGSDAKREAIRKAWATGKFSSRDACAEQESAALGMSFSTARRHLRGTEDPSSAA